MKFNEKLLALRKYYKLNQKIWLSSVAFLKLVMQSMKQEYIELMDLYKGYIIYQ